MTDDPTKPTGPTQPTGPAQPTGPDSNPDADGPATAGTIGPEPADTGTTGPEPAGTGTSGPEPADTGTSGPGSTGPEASGPSEAGPGGAAAASGGPGGTGGTGGPSWSAGPGGPGGPGWGPPPPSGAFSSRYGLVRPRQGRYLAGVCAAIGRATNTDPILWRVLLAVLGFFGGIGILVYLVMWLATPSEGDNTSPVEGLLGRGRSSMSPVTVLVLGILAAVIFAFIVTDSFRAVLLGSAVLIGGALLLNRNAGQLGPVPGESAAPPGYGPPGYGPAGHGSAGHGSAGYHTPAGWPAYGPSADKHPGPGAASADQPAPPVPPAPGQPVGASYPAVGYPATMTQPPPTRPAMTPYPVPGQAPGAQGSYPAGYRPPFAPYGPYASRPSPTGPVPPPPPPPSMPIPPVPPPPPRERSRLGTVTFSMIFVVLGLVAAIDLTDAAPTPPSAYFAAVLATIAVGLLVGAWFGRARWLIALGLVAAAAVGISSLAESAGQARYDDVTWRPASYEQVALRYETTFGNAVLDLRNVDFTDQRSDVTVRVSLGELRVYLPPEVDVRTEVDVGAGEARVLGERWSGFDQGPRIVSDLGSDGAGGGDLTLRIRVSAGDVEVVR